MNTKALKLYVDKIIEKRTCPHTKKVCTNKNISLLEQEIEFLKHKVKSLKEENKTLKKVKINKEEIPDDWILKTDLDFTFLYACSKQSENKEHLEKFCKIFYLSAINLLAKIDLENYNYKMLVESLTIATKEKLGIEDTKE